MATGELRLQTVHSIVTEGTGGEANLTNAT